MRKAFLLLVACLISLVASAVPARPGTFTVTQPDGTVLTLSLVGDEHFSYFVSVDDGQRYFRQADGTFRLAPGEEISRMQAAASVRRTMANDLRLQRMAKLRNLSTEYTSASDVATLPHKATGQFNNELVGQKKGLVILVNFADLEHSFDDPRQVWDDAFNKVGYNENGHVGSVHDYFYDQSYGKFDLEFDVVGPVTVSRNMSYYGQNSYSSKNVHAGEMVVEACRLVNSAVNFKDYDWDGDGEVDQVYIIYAGYGESSGAPAETIWPHEYWLQYAYGQSITLDGVKIDTYACSCELDGTSGTNQAGIGTACHEFSHCIGYPDLYDTGDTGGFGMDAMSVLGSGSYNGPGRNSQVPCGFTAYERWMAGWLTPIELKEGCSVTDMPNLGDEPVAYVIYNDRTPNEYFLLENRQATRWFSYTGSGEGQHGLLVFHIDYDAKQWSDNSVNSDPNHQRMCVIPAGKLFGTYYPNYRRWATSSLVYQSMTFPGRNGVTELTNDSHYDCGGKLFNRNTDGTYYMNKPITDIAEDTSRGTISFIFMEGPDDGSRWTVSLEAGSGTTDVTTWTQQTVREGIVLPKATPAYEGWRFAGWSTEAVDVTMDRPARLYAAGDKYIPAADVTLYAVYGYCDDDKSAGKFSLVEEIKDGRRYVFATKGAATDVEVYAITASTLNLDAYQKTPQGGLVEVDFSGAVPTITYPASDVIWTATVSEAGVSLVNDSRYLVMSNSGMKLSDVFATVQWDVTYGMYGFNSGGTAKYFIHPSSSKFSFSTTKTDKSRVFAYEEFDFFDQDVTYATTVPTGLHTVSTTAPAAAVYDLYGRRAVAPHGIFIRNGRKIYKK